MTTENYLVFKKWFKDTFGRSEMSLECEIAMEAFDFGLTTQKAELKALLDTIKEQAERIRELEDKVERLKLEAKADIENIVRLEKGLSEIKDIANKHQYPKIIDPRPSIKE